MATRTVIFVLGLALVPGCKKKGDAPAAGSGASTSSTSAGSAAPATAAGGEVQALPVVTDCPKSLGGTEKVARTITKACGPITVTETLTVDGSLTLEAGAVLKFQPDTGLVIGYHGPAKLIVKGGEAPDQRVVLTSAGDQAPGVWTGVTLDDGADRSQITGLDIQYAGQTGGAALALRDAVDIVLTKSSISHAKEVGVSTQGKSAFAQFAANRFDDIGRAALAVDPGVVDKLAAGNTFAKDAFIEVRGGSLTGDATWKNVGAPFHVIGSVYAETATGPASLTIAFATLAFAPDAELAVGYHSRGKLRITGTSVLTSLDGKPGTWPGVRIYDGGEATIETATITSGGDDHLGAVAVKRGGKLTLGEVAFKDNKLALSADEGSTLAAAKPLTFAGNALAARLSPTALGALTAANVFGDGDVIEVSPGALAATTTWLTQPKVQVHVMGDVAVEGDFTLTVAAGGTYLWKGGAGLSVAYHGGGTLKVAGTEAAPVVFGALVAGEPWTGIRLDEGARNVELTHLELADVGGDAGVIATRSAVGKLDHVRCARCAATVAPACGAKLDTATAVTAGASTPVAIKKATGC
jgi:hypothetical protein